MKLKIGKLVDSYRKIKKGSAVIVKNSKECIYFNKDLAYNLKCSHWNIGKLPYSGDVGIVENILKYKNSYYFSITIRGKQYIFPRTGLGLCKNNRGIEIKIKKEILDRFSRILRNYDGEENSSDPSCFMLGMNKQNIVDSIVKLEANDEENSCENMISICGSELADKMVKLLKNKKKPIGIARIGSFSDKGEKYGATRGYSLKEIGRTNKDAIILSYSYDGIKIESYDPKTDRVKNYLLRIAK